MNQHFPRSFLSQKSNVGHVTLVTRGGRKTLIWYSYNNSCSKTRLHSKLRHYFFLLSLPFFIPLAAIYIQRQYSHQLTSGGWKIKVSVSSLAGIFPCTLLGDGSVEKKSLVDWGKVEKWNSETLQELFVSAREQNTFTLQSKSRTNWWQKPPLRWPG